MIQQHFWMTISEAIEQQKTSENLYYLHSPLLLKDGAIIYFFDSNHTNIYFNSTILNDSSGELHEYFFIEISFFDGKFHRTIPTYQLHFPEEGNILQIRNIQTELKRIKKLLEKPWKVKRQNVEIPSEFDNRSYFIIYDLIECDEQTILNWYFDQEEQLMQKEIEKVVSPIKYKYAKIREQNTTYSDTFVKSYRENEREHHHFKWDEGFDEWTTWTRVDIIHRKEYYKGLFVKEYDIEIRTDESL